ncbi:helix-turn-helix domain-containing protein [Nitratireductor sp. GCM10026969]|uniref:helix-turn-helix domain-containing protein n=1 Tax=Nitratireductor sp. GCM10026969 TaxID=3252645 RepID=UPI00361EBD2D
MSEPSTQSEGANAGQAIPRSVFDTSILPQLSAFEDWQEQLEPICEARLSKSSDMDFHARVESVVLDKIVIGDMQLTPQAFDRSRFCIARHGVEHYVLHFFKRGRLVCRNTETGNRLEPGDMLVADMAHPQRMVLTDIDFLHVAVPRPLLAPLLIEPDAYPIRHIRGDNILVKMLHDQMYSLVSYAHQISVSQAQALMPAILQLSAAAINGMVGERTADGVRQSLTQAIRRHVSIHALDPDLSPQRIAAQFGISRRKLSYLFQEDGGVSTYMQNERLRLACQALMDPAQRGRTIGEIAQAHGFSHRTSFIRAFERVYNLTPSQQRALATDRRRTGAGTTVEPAPFRWIDIP